MNGAERFTTRILSWAAPTKESTAWWRETDRKCCVGRQRKTKTKVYWKMLKPLFQGWERILPGKRPWLCSRPAIPAPPTLLTLKPSLKSVYYFSFIDTLPPQWISRCMEVTKKFPTWLGARCSGHQTTLMDRQVVGKVTSAPGYLDRQPGGLQGSQVEGRRLLQGLWLDFVGRLEQPSILSKCLPYNLEMCSCAKSSIGSIIS